MALWARLYPLDKKRGFVKGRLNHGGTLYIGGEKPHWYKVSEAKAAQLAELHQQDQDPHSHPVFQIVDEAKKAAIDKLEQDRRMAALGMYAATHDVPHNLSPREVDLTTADLPGKGREAAIPPTAAAAEPEVAVVQTSPVRSVLTPLGPSVPAAAAPPRVPAPVAASVPEGPAAEVTEPPPAPVSSAPSRRRGKGKGRRS